VVDDKELDALIFNLPARDFPVVQAAIKVLRQQVAELEGEAMTRSQDDGKLEREIERLQGQVADRDAAIRRQANSAKMGMDAALAISGQQMQQAEKLRAESSPGALESERAMNAILTDELTASLERVAVLRQALTQIFIGCDEDKDGLTYDEIAKIADAAVRRVTETLSPASDKEPK